MKIGVDARELSGEKAGKGWYVYHVLKSILELDSKNDYVLYAKDSIDFPKYPNAKVVKISFSGLFWHISVARRLKKDKIDLYWAPTSPIIPALTNVSSVITIHDLTNILLPKKHTGKGQIVEKIFLRRALNKVEKIITISESTKNDLKKLFPWAKNKIIVTPLGYDKHFKPMTEDKAAPILEKYSLKKGYVLFVGTIEPRKNIEFLLESYGSIPEKLRTEHPLVLAGKKGWLCENIFKKINECKKKFDIRYLDYVSFSDLPAIYNGASVFVFPSLYEGFGLPPLEAMACGKPVIVSNLSSLPEVVGNSGIKIDLNNTRELAEKIIEVLSDKNFKEDLERKSLLQSQKFSWENTAKETLKNLTHEKNE